MYLDGYKTSGEERKNLSKYGIPVNSLQGETCGLAIPDLPDGINVSKLLEQEHSYSKLFSSGGGDIALDNNAQILLYQEFKEVEIPTAGSPCTIFKDEE